MKPSSGKNKGRKLQQWVVKMLVDYLECDPNDVTSRPMGSGGEDVIVGNESRRKFPYSVECKNVERLNVWEAYGQACSNSKEYEPLLVMKKNGKKPLVVLDAEHFFTMNSVMNDLMGVNDDSNYTK